MPGTDPMKPSQRTKHPNFAASPSSGPAKWLPARRTTRLHARPSSLVSSCRGSVALRSRWPAPPCPPRRLRWPSWCSPRIRGAQTLTCRGKACGTRHGRTRPRPCSRPECRSAGSPGPQCSSGDVKRKLEPKLFFELQVDGPLTKRQYLKEQFSVLLRQHVLTLKSVRVYLYGSVIQ